MKWIEWSPVPVTPTAVNILPRKYSRGLIIFSLLIFLPLAVLGTMSVGWPIHLQLLPLFISLFIFGMPHGGADHLLLWGMLKKDSWSGRIVSITLYTLAALIYLIFWRIYPLGAALFFLGLTIFHWGQGDRYISLQLHRANYLTRSTALTALHILYRGSIPILVPGFLGNETYRGVIEALVSSSGRLSYQAQWVTNSSILFLLVPLGLFALYNVCSLGRIEKSERKSLWIDRAEALILLIWFLFIPPLWAIGCYFVFWHSLRHTLRILWTDQLGSQLIETGKYFRLKIRWLELTSLMTVIALIGMWAAFNMSFSLRGIELSWLAKALIGISVLTLPHTIVVCFMDRMQIRSK